MATGGDDTPDLFTYAAQKAARASRVEEPPADAPSETKVVPGSREAPLTVAQLVRRSAHVLEREVGMVWIAAEVGSLTRASSGHLYFALKDDRAQVRAVMWRADAKRLRFRFEDGLAVLCRGKVNIYERDGKFQFYVQSVEPAGVGADALALEQLKQKLAAEGLFAADKKRPLPKLPRRIGVITSKSGAAVRDVIRAVHRRFPVPILVVDAQVQGATAPRQLIAALADMARCDVDVVIMGRGGGAASDLAAFNDEALVRAVAAFPLPIISAVGHEVDVSLTDLAADVRAATPTMAGEMAVPVLADLEDTLAKEERRLRREMVLRIASARQELDSLVGRAGHRLAASIAIRRQAITALRGKLEGQHPRARLAARRSQLRELESALATLSRRSMERASRDLSTLVARLDALSPLKVLGRGYSIASRDDGVVVTDAAAVAIGTGLHVRLARGSLACRVEERHLPVNEEES